MDLAFDYMARNVQSQDAAEAARFNEHRRIAEERRALEPQPIVPKVSRWYRVVGAVSFRRSRGFENRTAQLS
jgi:hypothetical protein